MTALSVTATQAFPSSIDAAQVPPFGPGGVPYGPLAIVSGQPLTFAPITGAGTWTIGTWTVEGAEGQSVDITPDPTADAIRFTAVGYDSSGVETGGPLPVTCTAPSGLVLASIPITSGTGTTVTSSTTPATSTASTTTSTATSIATSTTTTATSTTTASSTPTTTTASTPTTTTSTTPTTTSTTSSTTATSTATSSPTTTTTSVTSTTSSLPVPAIRALFPHRGRGGSLVLVYGSGFASADGVFFGGQSAIFLALGDRVIVALAPFGPEGTVDVTVRNRYGMSVPTPADRFTYPGGPGMPWWWRLF